jgi:hypothetical protein
MKKLLTALGENRPRKRLTDRNLKALKPAKAGSRYDVMDADVSGLGCA